MGTYGTIRPADMKPEDVEITVFYSQNRENLNTSVFKLDSSNLVEFNNPNATGVEIFGGLYTLRLPVGQFNAKGIYTIVFKPKEIRTKIVDCGVLSAYPDIKGLVFDASASELEGLIDRFENNKLVGYRIEYLTNDANGDGGTKIRNFFKIITSNNRAEPVNQNLSNTNQKAIRYRFNDNSTLVYCTVSPSTPSNVKPNSTPYIGSPNQDVIITNTFFTPFTLEVELVEYDLESIAIAMFGNQTKSLEDGIYTIYNFENQIYKQYNLFEIKDQFTGKPLFEIKEDRGSSIDFNKGFNDITTI